MSKNFRLSDQMRMLKNFSAGFVVSLLGGLPFGMINITAFQVFETHGGKALLAFVCGVVLIEYLVVYLLLKGISWLSRNTAFMKSAAWLSILMLILLGVVILLPDKAETGVARFSAFLTLPPLVLGVMVNGMNLMQVPFWTGWNMVLLKGRHIDIRAGLKHIYLTGVCIGTSLAIVLFVCCVNLLGDRHLEDSTIQICLAAACFVLAGMQIFKMLRGGITSRNL